ncbi:putative lipoprotein [Prevotella sp. CAG:1092]|nr:GSCFA domain-containing protein [Prevotella sp.]MDD7708576.1 GSCFA domain-containing protein [Prevotella sp.]MDY4150860.1 GSCFA domain-containing protein [Prevotella sp.]CCZ12994.1 putative lipoprotein [Prevotella sp. CAG:1092]
MEFRTIVDIPTPEFTIEPQEKMLFVGSCFADNIGKRFVDEMFLATVNPLGVMYNPASILHTIQSIEDAPRVAFLTLGTNHVYILKETGEIVDNCRKRPARLFHEEELTVDECAEYLQKAVDILYSRNKDVQVVVTVSPIRYAKYGYHGSQLSKATLQLAADKLVKANVNCTYFPAYEIVNDELRDYRFYREDMLHPTDQTVEYIWQRLQETYLSNAAKDFIESWRPLKEAIRHRPFNPNGAEYIAFANKTKENIAKLRLQYPLLPLIPEEFGIFANS